MKLKGTRKGLNIETPSNMNLDTKNNYIMSAKCLAPIVDVMKENSKHMEEHTKITVEQLLPKIKKFGKLDVAQLTKQLESWWTDIKHHEKNP